MPRKPLNPEEANEKSGASKHVKCEDNSLKVTPVKNIIMVSTPNKCLDEKK